MPSASWRTNNIACRAAVSLQDGRARLGDAVVAARTEHDPLGLLSQHHGSRLLHQAAISPAHQGAEHCQTRTAAGHRRRCVLLP